jgi:chaperonin GroES
MIKLLRDQVLVQPVVEEQRTASGLIMPGTVGKTILKGVVVSVGSGYLLEDGTRIPVEVVAGDKVLYATGHSELDFRGEKFHLMVETNIVGVLPKEE